jgi:hypothetical protein
MNIKIRFEDTCQVTCEDNGKTVTADVLDFKEGKALSVSLNKSLKLVMPWNGRVYEGKMGGMSFVTDGPKGMQYKEGR